MPLFFNAEPVERVLGTRRLRAAKSKKSVFKEVDHGVPQFIHSIQSLNDHKSTKIRSLCPSRHSARIFPLWAVTMLWAMDRPRP